MIKVKICGIKTLEDGLAAVDAGANALGFVFAPSHRRIKPETARNIISQLPPFITTVGVFVDEDPQVVDHVARYCKLGALQFHGNESIEYCLRFGRQVIKAFRVKDEKSLAILASYKGLGLLLDSYVPGTSGGTGKTFNWSLAKKAKEYGPVILAGGLNPENISQAIREANPYGVDVSSGVETDGLKDHDKIKKFIEEVRRCRDATR